MPRLHPRVLAPIGLVAATLLLASCAGAAAPESQPDTEPTTVTTETEAPAPEATLEPADEQPEPGDAPTCETLISASLVADFEEIGWTVREDPFYIGDLELTDGIQCVWADFEGPAGDHLQMFGWGPISAEEAESAQDQLIAQGWQREDGSSGVYITENSQTTIATDDDGYGMTYLFGDGVVTFADTKQGLVLIDWPRG
ncbi:hypothetical protein [Microbacterium hominis]|uniref:Nitrate ABC transporter substrate-binding protein n=1 Tax=Microbacterium hominis TaxID=162426 RepID=A0A7D4TF96_9MICO|nr:hypothetical protein [Microbacterium hominis]QKJ19200.1 hypothetical protein HQM25_07340 [Microbacterium hominis]